MAAAAESGGAEAGCFGAEGETAAREVADARAGKRLFLAESVASDQGVEIKITKRTLIMNDEEYKRAMGKGRTGTWAAHSLATRSRSRRCSTVSP